MIASYCAPIGFGSDIGGSLRIPSAFTGLVTLKMFNRYSRMGNCYYGQFTGGLPLKSELGPITRSVSDLIMVHQYMYDNANYNDIPA
jgi:Asp-tRNA(Asn)/Glu-tRNA(Gln) amidotransferase A subunit family amidase